MILRDFHIHTTFSDGKNTPEEVVREAIKKGIECIGFSDHSYTFFDDSYCVSQENTPVYKDEIERLKSKYADKIKIYCGIEQDYYSAESTGGYDYVIGSVHYVKAGQEYIPVDESTEALKRAVEKYFNGDYIKFAEEYFKTVAKVAEKTNADIIGHFDLVSKFNESGLFDENDKRYISAWKNAADRLLLHKKPFEVNTGAISRGYKTFPYPAEDMIEYIKQNGGELILSSDAHFAQNICYQFEKWNKLI